MSKKIYYEVDIDKPCMLFLQFDIPKGESLNIKGYDKDYPLIVIFDREVDISGDWHFRCIVPMKVRLIIEIEKLKNVGGSCKLIQKWEENISPDPSYTFSKNKQNFIKWIFPLCYFFNYLKSGVYRSPCGRFTLTVGEKVIDVDTGQEVPTPARVNREKGDFYVSKEWLSECTVPMRLFIMLHEFFHFYLQSTNEILVDREAAQMYVALNLPRIELLFALTKVFSGETLESYQNSQKYSKYENGLSEQEQRVKLMYEFIEDYKPKK